MTGAGSMLTAAAVIDHLNLAPHPEGGHYRETFRDTTANEHGRAASTAIYFLLRRGEVSRWHRVDAVEVWHWYAGEPIELTITDGASDLTRLRLGNDLTNGERPQAIVRASHWQQARSLGDWTLVGCTVAPGFEFAGFKLLPPDAETPNTIS